MDILETIDNLPLTQRLFYAAFPFLVLNIILSIIRYKKKDERISLLFRHISGFIVGVTDQWLMIVYGWQPGWVWEFIVWCYAVYTFWMLVIPDFLGDFEKSKSIILLTLWIFGIGTLATFIEMSTWISTYGYLPYPTEPYVWTPLTTWIFYLGVYAEGTFLVLLGYRVAEKYGKKEK